MPVLVGADPNDLTAVAGARVSPRPTLPGVWFDHHAADVAVAFHAWYIRFSSGDAAGRPFILEPWQAWIIRAAFGWKRANGKRLYERVFLWVPRGNGKTEMIAAVAILSLLAMGFEGGETYAIAGTESQARISFNAAKAMAGASPDLLPMVEARKTSLYVPATNSAFIPLTSKPTGKHGLRCSVLLGDEMHEWPDGDLYDFVRRSQIKIAEPLEFNISTAGKPTKANGAPSFGYELFDECDLITRGAIADPHTLVIIYDADPKKDDLTDPAVWKRVNPNLGVSINADKFATEIARLDRPSYAANIKRYNFNIWVDGDVDRAIPPDVWARNTAHPDDPYHWQDLERKLLGRRCFGGVDLNSSADLAALLWLFPPEGTETRWHMLPRFWWPRAAVDAQSRHARIPVERWEADEAMIVTPGDASDHRAIERQIHEDMDRFQVESLGVDAWNAHQILVDLQADRVPVVRVRFGMMTIGPAWKRFEKMLHDGEAEHGTHPVLAWNAAGVALKAPDDNGNTMPTKRRSTSKIDGIAAALIAKALAIQDAPQSYYVSQGLTVI